MVGDIPIIGEGEKTAKKPFKCCFCGGSEIGAIVLTNHGEEEMENVPQFTNMPVGEACHFECYIDESVRLSIENRKREA